MAYDEGTIEYHLTPGGWMTGDEALSIRVETWEKRYYQRSEWSKEQITWVCTWASPDVPRLERDALRKSFREFMGTPGRSGNLNTIIHDPR